jgi:putative hydrolase of the HAD superfamily
MLDGIRWVLFDAVGTLIYADPPVPEVYHAVGRQLGSQLSVDYIRKRFPEVFAAHQHVGLVTTEEIERERWRSIVQQVIVDAPHERDAIFETLWQHFAQPQHWRLYADVADVLTALRRRLHVGIASNFDGRLKRIISGHPPLAACEAVLLSSEIGYAKPDPRFFQAAQEQLGVAPAAIALVGDDEVADVQGATSAGWRAIRLDRNKAQVPGSIQTLAQLLS